MLKKIQQYLLLNHPLLWNIKIVPALLGALIINIFFFIGGYILTKVDFSYAYSNPFSGAALAYMGAILTSILLFIIWLVFYSKNNAFKSFYPRSSGGLYLEWILTFVIILGFVSFPFSYHQGSISKVKSYASKSEMIKAVETLNLIKILIPTDKTSYYQEYPTDLPPNSSKYDPNMGAKYSDSIEMMTYEDRIEYFESQNISYEDYPNFAQLSLLNYYTLDQFYFPSKCDFTVRNSDTVKKWLIEQNKEEISKLMDAFIALQDKHNLSMNFTKDEWMELVYNPAKYPVGDFNLITPYNYKEEDAKSGYSYYYDSSDKNSSGYYVSYSELEGAYNKIMDAYLNKEEAMALCVAAMCIALCVSLLVFSFRASSGKAWLIAAISMGLILFINGILSLAISSPMDSGVVGPLFYIFVMLAIFSFEIASVIRKNIGRKAKGKSDILINHLIWFIPAVPALIFMAIYILGHDQYSYMSATYKSKGLYETYQFMDEHIVEFVLGNVCLTFVSVWFFIQMVLRKWKSLPEQ